MTVARAAVPQERLRMPPARLEVAWTASARALDASAGYASAALRVEIEWDPADSSGRGAVRASLDRSGRVAAVSRPAAVEVRAVRRGAWTHVEVAEPGSLGTVLVASFRDGRLCYCASEAPRAAGLAGGTYDPPTGILELYAAS